jgi:prevent-host-death family protein
MLNLVNSNSETIISARQASHNLSHYLSEAASGKSFTVVKHGRPMAKLVPIQAARHSMRTPQEQAAFDKKLNKAMSFRFTKPYIGKFNRQDAYDDI